MFSKGNLFYSDWRDKDGARHRKSFTTAAAATVYEDAQKAKLRPKHERSRRHRCVRSRSLRRKAVLWYADLCATNDLDIFIRPTEENARAAFAAPTALGVPLDGLEPSDPL